MSNPASPMKLKILTVDDSKMVRIMVARAFKSYDCIVLEATNGEEGIVVARREHPDLILLDYTMPVMDGLDTMTALRADPAIQNIPVIMLTAEGSKGIMAKMASLGVRDYLVKPLKETALVARAGRVVSLNLRDALTLPDTLPEPAPLPSKDF